MVPGRPDRQPIKAAYKGSTAVERARRDLMLLHGAFDQHEPLELLELDDEATTLARKYFDNGYRLLSGL